MLLTTTPHLKYAATLPCNLSLMACLADINVSQGSVATYARSGGIFNIRWTTNLGLPRNLSVSFLIGLDLTKLWSWICGSTFLAHFRCTGANGSTRGFFGGIVYTISLNARSGVSRHADARNYRLRTTFHWSCLSVSRTHWLMWRPLRLITGMSRCATNWNSLRRRTMASAAARCIRRCDSLLMVHSMIGDAPCRTELNSGPS